MLEDTFWPNLVQIGWDSSSMVEIGCLKNKDSNLCNLLNCKNDKIKWKVALTRKNNHQKPVACFGEFHQQKDDNYWPTCRHRGIDRIWFHNCWARLQLVEHHLGRCMWRSSIHDLIHWNPSSIWTRISFHSAQTPAQAHPHSSHEGFSQRRSLSHEVEEHQSSLEADHTSVHHSPVKCITVCTVEHN